MDYAANVILINNNVIVKHVGDVIIIINISQNFLCNKHYVKNVNII